jgi:iron(III) transport system permease protein
VVAIPTESTSARGADVGLAGGGLLAAAVLATVYLISAPLFMLLASVFRGPQDLLPFEPGTYWTLSNLAQIYVDKTLYSAVIPNTIVFTLGSVTLTFTVAFTLAWLVERTDMPWRTTTFTVVLFPLLVPGIILGIAWILLMAPKTGLLNVAIRATLGLNGEGPLNIFSMGGLIFAQGIALVPFVFLLLTAALRSMNPVLEEASNTSGASPAVTFFRVTLPILRPGILAPLILATLVTLEQFEMPLILGLPARISVFATRIYYELNPDTDLPAFGRAAAVALPFLAAGLLLLWFYNRMTRRADRFVTITGKGYRPTRIEIGRWKLPALAFVGLYAAFAVISPALVLVWASLFGYQAPSLAALSSINFSGYLDMINSARFWAAVRNTFVVAGGSAALVTIIGALLSWTILRTRWPGRSVLDFVSFLSIGIPSVIAGLACMLLYLSLPIALYGTVWVLILAYSYRLAVTTRLSRAALMQIHGELEEASHVSGGRWFTTIRRVVLPLLAPSLLASFVLLFIIGFREFTLPVLLQSRENEVLSVIMWKLLVGNQTLEAAAVGTTIVILIIPVIFLMRRLLLGREAK